jgi:hypothetical protein
VQRDSYIDESHGPEQDLFALSCVMARPSDWLEIVRKWKLHLDAKNKALKKAGRPEITRYHATDCSGCKREFKGWDRDERDEFVRGLFSIIGSKGLHTTVFDTSLEEVCAVFPEWSDDRLKAGYRLLTKFLLYLTGQDFKHFFGDGHAEVRLFHDQTSGNGKYDPTIARAFEEELAKPDFPYGHNFSTIAPVTWQSQVELQLADLVAFECFKQARRSPQVPQILRGASEPGSLWDSFENFSE